VTNEIAAAKRAACILQWFVRGAFGAFSMAIKLYTQTIPLKKNNHCLDTRMCSLLLTKIAHVKRNSIDNIDRAKLMVNGFM
jgi:hypothetical protein